MGSFAPLLQIGAIAFTYQIVRNQIAELLPGVRSFNDPVLAVTAINRRCVLGMAPSSDERRVFGILFQREDELEIRQLGGSEYDSARRHFHGATVPAIRWSRPGYYSFWPSVSEFFGGTDGPSRFAGIARLASRPAM